MDGMNTVDMMTQERHDTSHLQLEAMVVKDCLQASVIVCTRDRGDRIVRTLKSILLNRGPEFDVLIVDQSRDNATVESIRSFLRDPRVRYLQMRETGLSRARNSGIAASRGELVIFTDDDCEVAGDWIAQIVNAFHMDEKIQMVFGCVKAGIHDSSRGLIPSYEISEPFIAHTVMDKYRIDGMGACMAIRRKAWVERSGFDVFLGAGSSLRSAEENDFALRTLAAGGWIFETPAVHVKHNGFHSHEEVASLVAGYLLGSGAMFVKQVRLGHLQILPLFLRIFWRWLFKRPLVHYSSSRKQLFRLVWLCRGGIAGARLPIDPKTGKFTGSIPSV
jgi:GT2 family glycosyltransferase